MDEGAELAASVRSIAQGLVVVADNSLRHQGGEVVVVVPADALYSNGYVGGRESVVPDPDVGADKVGLLLGQQVGTGLRRRRGQVGKVLVGHLDELLVGHTAGANEHHAVGRVIALDIVHKLGPGDVADVLAGAENSAAQGLLLVRGRMQVVEDDFLQLLLNLL